MNRIIEKSIKAHRIYIAEKHHHVLLPWAKIKKENKNEKLLLFSFDHHTDTIEPFSRYCKNEKEQMSRLVDCIKYDDEASVNDAIEHLRNDEHIKCAIQSGILYKAFIISHSNSFDSPVSIEEQERMNKLENNYKEYLKDIICGDYGISPRESRHYRDSDIYMPPFLPEDMYIYSGELDDVVLEDDFLEDKINTLKRMCPNIFDKNGLIKYKYILDIDLDYFHTMKSINPKSMDIFSTLVKRATAITIAKEPDCVELVRSDEQVTSEVLLKKLLAVLEEVI